MQATTFARCSPTTGDAHAPRRLISVAPHGGAPGSGLLFISPWVIGFLAFFVYPFFATLYYSFTNFNGVRQRTVIGFTNYVNLFHDPLFKTSLFNTFYYTAIELPLSTVVALGLALLLNMNVKGRAIYRTIFYIPSIVPTRGLVPDLRLDIQPGVGDRQRPPHRRPHARPGLVLLDRLVKAVVHPARPVGPRPADGHLPGGPAERAPGDVRGGGPRRGEARGSGSAT